MKHHLLSATMLILAFPSVTSAADPGNVPGKNMPAGAQSVNSVAGVSVAPVVGVAARTISPKITGLKITSSPQADGPYEVRVLGQGLCTFNVMNGDNAQPSELTKALPVVLNHAYGMSSNTVKAFKVSVAGVAGKCSGAANGEVTVWAGGSFVPPLSGAAPVISSQPAVTSMSCPPGKKC